MAIKVAINGYGRIGRNILRALYEGKHGDGIKIVAINDLGDANTNVHLTRFDTVHGRFRGDVHVDGDSMVVNGDRIRVVAQRDPAKLPWGEMGVAGAVGRVMRKLKGKFDGFPIRVPTINVSLVDFTFTAARKTTVDEIHDAIKAAANGPLKGILAYNDQPLVSVDFNHDPASSTYDATMTKVIERTLVKVCAWYDNEWGFSNRMLDTTLAWSTAA